MKNQTARIDLGIGVIEDFQRDHYKVVVDICGKRMAVWRTREQIKSFDVVNFAPPTKQKGQSSGLRSDFPIGVPVPENASKSHPKPILAITPYQPEQVALAVIGEAQDKRSEVERDRYGIPTSYRNKEVGVLLEHLEAGDIYCAEKKDQYRHHAGEERIAILSISPRIEDKSVYSWGETRVDRYRLAWVCHEDGRKELVKLRSWLSHYRVVGGAKLHAAQDTRNILIPFKMTTPVWKGTKAA